MQIMVKPTRNFVNSTTHNPKSHQISKPNQTTIQIRVINAHFLRNQHCKGVAKVNIPNHQHKPYNYIMIVFLRGKENDVSPGLNPPFYN